MRVHRVPAQVQGRRHLGVARSGRHQPGDLGLALASARRTRSRRPAAAAAGGLELPGRRAAGHAVAAALGLGDHGAQGPGRVAAPELPECSSRARLSTISPSAYSMRRPASRARATARSPQAIASSTRPASRATRLRARAAVESAIGEVISGTIRSAQASAASRSLFRHGQRDQHLEAQAPVGHVEPRQVGIAAGDQHPARSRRPCRTARSPRTPRAAAPRLPGARSGSAACWSTSRDRPPHHRRVGVVAAHQRRRARHHGPHRTVGELRQRREDGVRGSDVTAEGEDPGPAHPGHHHRTGAARRRGRAAR